MFRRTSELWLAVFDRNYIHPNLVLRNNHMYFFDRYKREYIKVVVYNLASKSVVGTCLYNEITRLSGSLDEIFLPTNLPSW
jgi:hypothetical protein